MEAGALNRMPAQAARRSGPAKRGNNLLSFKSSLDPLRLAVVGIIVVNISAVQMYMGPVQYMRPALLCQALALAVLVMNPAAGGWAMLKTWPTKVVAAFFLLSCVSGVFGISLGTSALFIMNVYVRNIIVFFLMVLAIRNVKDLAVLMWGLVISVGIVTILAQTVLEMDVTMTGLGRLNGGQSSFDANDMGMILVMTMPLALLFFFHTRGKLRILSVFMLVAIPVTIALTGSRGAMLGMVAVGAAILVTLNKISVAKRVGFVLVAMVGLFLGAPKGYWKQMGTLLDLKNDYNYSIDYGRKGIAIRGIGYMLRFPVSGVGPANFGRAEGTISPIIRARAQSGQAVNWIAPHNTYVQVGAEMGVLAFGMWFTLLGGGTIGLLRLRKRLPRSWEKGTPERRFLRDCCVFLPIAFLGFAVTSTFLSHAYTLVPYILFAFLGGVVLLTRRELARDKAERMLSQQQALAFVQSPTFGNLLPRPAALALPEPRS